MNAHQLCLASIENLERLARFMGVSFPSGTQDYKVKLVVAILRHESVERAGSSDSGADVD